MKEYIFNLEGVDFLQVVRKNGLVEIFKLNNNQVRIKTKYELDLWRDKIKTKNREIIMIAREFIKLGENEEVGKQ